ASFGMEEGTEATLSDDVFGLIIGKSVRFRFFSSTVRRDDRVGIRLDYWKDEELDELAEIEITLSGNNNQENELIPVNLRSVVTEIGTLELHAVSQRDDASWKIEFEVRSTEEASL
ncbi:MAG: Hsp70 family protein, partial [Methylococcales bacterium]|nr:Hsp70 family protein [Methylococcales bacterium]